ncbi:uncharacterized protein LOC113329640 [Papaver somniferum]|uniref:uncharacterized protein LOC113329640 n=1 Tax=Papaver somniferum TaxID=3469 RepID=UPI000E70231E|nr:uncharacterized protein LOC113329640 [Papaver somniferum]
MNIGRFVNGIQTIFSLCGQEDETVFHLFFECAYSRLVLEAAGFGFEIIYEGNSYQIIKNWIENDMENKFVMKVCILWNIWKSRKDITFSQGTFSVQLILKKASHDFDLCMENLPKSNGNSTGAVARDVNGRFLGCAFITFMETSPLLAKSVACRLGMELGKDLNYDKVIIEGDALNITTAVNGDVQEIPWSIRSEIFKIKDLASLFTVVNFQHVRKSANSMAHDPCQFAFHNK